MSWRHVIKSHAPKASHVTPHSAMERLISQRSSAPGSTTPCYATQRHVQPYAMPQQRAMPSSDLLSQEKPGHGKPYQATTCHAKPRYSKMCHAMLHDAILPYTTPSYRAATVSLPTPYPRIHMNPLCPAPLSCSRGVQSGASKRVGDGRRVPALWAVILETVVMPF
jgi:hypothetical protein